jgi:hypothetical protein
MESSILWIILIVAATAILALSLRYGVVGIRGGSVSRTDNPAAYWLAIVVLGLAILLCFLALLFER